MIPRSSLALLLAPCWLLAGCGASSRSSANARAAVATGASSYPASELAGSDAGLESGLHVRVLYGPTCPVQRIGQSCTRPYRASIRIVHEPDMRTLRTVRSSSDGRVSVRLRPGRYLLSPQAGPPLPRSRARAVTVYAHRFTSVTIHYDSGIR
ncbi:MAG: hypothetical protein E6G34_07360 [Actinobacteria bacterium]|nr:MAG: hypothetical protein E6G34_07360 [Actinomycetota bacterium]